MPETNARIKVCHDTAANFKTNNPTLLVGEWALETDTKKMKIGDGSTAYNSLPYSTAEDSDEWRKPDDWIDIRSGALPNSVYFLVGHSADYTTYPKFRFKATVSSGTYDVFVDGIKQATTNSEVFTELNWQTLALTSGFDVAYPTTLRTHIVRISPTTSTATLSAITTTDSNNKYASGLLWAHFTLTNVISLQSAFGNTDYNYHPIFETVTSVGNLLKVNSFYGAFARSPVKNIPVLDFSTMGGGVSISYSFMNSTRVKKVYLKNIAQTTGTANDMFQGANSLEEIIVEGSVNCGDRFFDTTSSLKKLPSGINFSNMASTTNALMQECGATVDAFLEFSSSSVNRIALGGKNSFPLTFVKGVTVSNEAPFTGASPQLDVSYTGLPRAALVNLFKSMPYNVGYTIVGTPNIVGGVASGFSANDYLQSSVNVTSNVQSYYKTNFEFQTRISLPQGYDVTRQLFYFPYRSGISGCRVTSAGVLEWYVYSDIVKLTAQLQEGTYWIKGVIQNNTVQLFTKTDNTQWALADSASAGDIGSAVDTNRPVILGNNWDKNSAFPGSIDLNETYININGVPWFRGTAAMTKTCNIIGCTGTSELTQEDKNIVLNKGWELTVA